jgi:allantoinase
VKPQKYGPFPYTPITRRAPIQWPDKVRLPLWIIPNVEVFHLDVAMPGDAQERPGASATIPAVRQWAQRDYGNRVGIWRIIDVMKKHGMRATVALNSDICLHMPVMIEEFVRNDWELIGHGRTNSQRVTEVPANEEGALIKDVFDTIEKVGGRRPIGWLGSGLQETWNTLDHLLDNGCRYVADWVNDDQPYVMGLDGRSMVSIPYPFELNDSVAFMRNKYSVPEFERMICDTFDVLYAESAHSARVMAISLHPFVIGHPHRIGLLDRALRYIMSHQGVWPATGTEIFEAYRDQLKTA